MNRTDASEPGTQRSSHLVRPLFPLALATFAVGTDAFVMAGLLPAIAADLGVSIPAAGQLVTMFALTLAIAAPVLSWLLSPLDRRKALQLALIVFVVGNVMTALSPNYPIALSARILTALGAATITATTSSAAVAITPAERRGRAMALVIGGLTLSTALGMPLGNLIGSVDWRLTLWAIAALGVVAAIGISMSLPKVVLPATGPDGPPGSAAPAQGALWRCIVGSRRGLFGRGVFSRFVVASVCSNVASPRPRLCTTLSNTADLSVRHFLCWFGI